MTVKKLPDVGRIQGVSVLPGSLQGERNVEIQYTDHKQQWHSVDMRFLDAMYLLSTLRAIQLDLGFSMPDDPRRS